MYGWFVDLAGPALGTVLFALVTVLALVLLFLAVYWLFGRAASSSLIGGSRGRRPRLAVLEAAAVDSRRRLVLIRRDDVEHLVMIGGPGDIVIESGIRRRPAQEPRLAPEPAVAETARPVPEPAVETPRPTPEPVVEAPRPAPEPVFEAPRPALEPVVEAPRPAPAMPAAPRFDPPVSAAPEPAIPSVELPRPQPAAPQHPPAGPAAAAAPRIDPQPAGEPVAARTDLDTELLRELEAGFQEKSQPQEPKAEESLSSIFAEIVRRHRG